MRITDFNIYKDLLKEKSGLIVTPDKSYLLDSRLTPVAKEWGFDGIEGLTTALQGVPDPKLIVDIVEAMTTNETSFFRDTKPFEILKADILPSIMENRSAQRAIKVWCAAASSGQEPYSLAMLLKDSDLPGLSSWNINIKATDISHDILDQARTGLYSQFEVQRGLEIMALMKHFTQQEDKWLINQNIRDMINFDFFNLLSPMASLGKFDIILCRNVLIYFDEGDKKDILERMAAQLEPDGFLFLGGAETVLGITDAFVPMPNKRGVYVKKDSPVLQSDAA